MSNGQRTDKAVPVNKIHREPVERPTVLVKCPVCGTITEACPDGGQDIPTKCYKCPDALMEEIVYPTEEDRRKAR